MLETIGTRAISPDEVNPENQVLWDGAQAFGVDPSLYHLNRFAPGRSPSPVNDKLDAALQLLLDAVQYSQHPLSVIPDAAVNELLFAPTSLTLNQLARHGSDFDYGVALGGVRQHCSRSNAT